MYSLNTISDRKGDKMRSMNQNVPQNGQINKCSSHVTTLNRESRQQLDGFFPLVLADSERYRQDSNLGP